jgi:hypothetical protein
MAGNRVELLGDPHLDAPSGRAGHDRLGEGMLRWTIGGRGQAQQLRLDESISRDDIGQRGLALRQGTGLVEDHRVDPGRFLERGGILEQHSLARALADADRDGRGSRERQGIGTCDDDRRDRGGQREQQALTAEDVPGDEGDDPGSERDVDEVFPRPIGKALGGGLARLRVLDHLDDP